MSDGQSHGEKLFGKIEKTINNNVHVRLSEDGPMVDLGVTAPELFSGALKTLDSLVKAVKPEYVSPILAGVLKKIREAEKGRPPGD